MKGYRNMSEQQRLFDLLRAGVTPFMCVDECERRLAEAGFEKINYKDAWKLVPGGKYVMNHHGTALFAFTVGKDYQHTDMIRMAAAHTDYPCMRIKPNPDFQTNGYAQINLEVYGGPILNTWFDRPLGVAGRVALRSDNPFEPKMVLYRSEKPIMTIPNLAIHMNREVNKGVEINNQVDLMPILDMLSEEQKNTKKLVEMTCAGFAEETASESPAPGGGSISAYMGALAAALGTMVANLSSHKAGWDDRWEFFSDWAERGMAVMNELLALVDEDTAAFNKIMDVFGMPKGTAEEKAARAEAMEVATLYATQVPLRTMKAAYNAFAIVRAMAEEGNPNSVSDAGVGALAARSAVMGACLNVKINAAGLKDRDTAAALVNEANEIQAQAQQAEKEILEIVESKINS